MKSLTKPLAIFSLSVIALFVSVPSNAALITPSDYIVAGNIGDTWDYERLDGTQFTWTLSEVEAGVNAGRLERGNSDSGIVYDQAGNVVSIYEIDKNALNPPLVIGETELGQVVTYGDPNDPNPTLFLFLKVPTISVQAGTYSDVLAWIFLDSKFSANSTNALLGLDPLITAAVTDVSFFAFGIGEVEYLGIDAFTGLSDGLGYELVSTSVPEPAVDDSLCFPIKAANGNFVMICL